ncbi:MAG: hypothetical protein FJW37_10275 [Acidobacteria bacterium]|nr:hypothetical protein [Acidobacteriota bacterium]
MGISRAGGLVSILLGAALQLPAQTQEESFRIYTEPPRLLLRPARLKLLTRERERRSLRWQQLETLILGKAPMPEPGFAYALFYRVSGNSEQGRQAVQWAIAKARESQPAELRQIALVFDWCQDLLSEPQAKALAAKLERGLAPARPGAAPPDLAVLRSRVLAAIALADRAPEVPARHLELFVRDWWRLKTAPALKAGRGRLTRDDMYPLVEILHAVRDNLQIEMRESAPGWFKELPLYLLASYYPATYPAAENEYRIPASHGTEDPDLRRATLSRAAELSLLAYEPNAVETQVLQGWLMHDRFLLRGTFGIPYEFLWANPYHPGLSYYHVPLILHDRLHGRLFVRSSWDDSATWLGYFDGELQLFRDGMVTVLSPQLTSGPIALDEAVVFFGGNSRKFRVLLKDDEAVFVLGLKPNQKYDLEIDDEEIREARTDAGGILPLRLPPKIDVGVRIKEAGAPAAASDARADPVTDPAVNQQPGR